MRASSALLALLLAAEAAPAAELVPNGQYEWREDRGGFGGFSGLVMADDGASFLTVSDAGEMAEAAVNRDADGRITQIATIWHRRLLDNLGKPATGFTSDAEALTRAPDGQLYIGYESYTRVASVTLPGLEGQTLHEWDLFRDHWGNAGFEALAVLPDGRLIAILEKAGEAGFSSFIGEGTTWRPGPSLPAEGGFDAVDAGVGPDGKLWLLERRLTSARGFATRIRRFAYDNGRFAPPEILLQTDPGTLDNMEGMGFWTDPQGRNIVSLISDDNFLFVQKTILAEFLFTE